MSVPCDDYGQVSVPEECYPPTTVGEPAPTTTTIPDGRDSTTTSTLADGRDPTTTTTLNDGRDTTTTTTCTTGVLNELGECEPVGVPVSEPATPGTEPVTRGTQIEVDYPWPDDGLLVYPITSASVAVGQPPVPGDQTLPVTGTGSTIFLTAVLFSAAGCWIRQIGKREER